MFKFIEQRFNEQTVELIEAKKKQTVDKIESKKRQSVLMADIRIIILETKIHPITVTAPVTTPVFPVAFPVFAPTFTTERKEIFPKLPTYHGIKKNSAVVPPSSG